MSPRLEYLQDEAPTNRRTRVSQKEGTGWSLLWILIRFFLVFGLLSYFYMKGFIFNIEMRLIRKLYGSNFWKGAASFFSIFEFLLNPDLQIAVLMTLLLMYSLHDIQKSDRELIRYLLLSSIVFLFRLLLKDIRPFLFEDGLEGKLCLFDFGLPDYSIVFNYCLIGITLEISFTHKPLLRTLCYCLVALISIIICCILIFNHQLLILELLFSVTMLRVGEYLLLHLEPFIRCAVGNFHANSLRSLKGTLILLTITITICLICIVNSDITQPDFSGSVYSRLVI